MPDTTRLDMAAADKATFGLKLHQVCAFCYALGWFSGLLFLIVEKESRAVRYHALHSIILFGPLTAFAAGLFVLAWLFQENNWVRVPVLLGGILAIAGGAILWVRIFWKTWKGVEVKIPVTTDLARRFTSEGSI